MSAEFIRKTEAKIKESARNSFTEHSLGLCEERMVALDLRHLLPALLGMSMAARAKYADSGEDWREAVTAELAPQFSDPAKAAGIAWAFDALEERT